MSQQCVNVHAHHANLIDLWYSVAIHHLTIYCTFKSFQISIIFMNAFCMSLKSIVTFSLTYIPNFACSTYMYIVLVIMDFVLSFFSGKVRTLVDLQNQMHRKCIWTGNTAPMNLETLSTERIFESAIAFYKIHEN